MNMDLLAQKVIEGDVKEPYNITNLDYYNVIIRGNFDCSGTKITSLAGAPKEVSGHFDCGETNITSFHNVHKQIKHIGVWFNIPLTIKSHILGVMFIKELKGITVRVVVPKFFFTGGSGGAGVSSRGFGGVGVGVSGGSAGVSNTVMSDGNWGVGNLVPKELQQAITIINKHLTGDRNPHEVQEELIDAGLSEYAKL